MSSLLRHHSLRLRLHLSIAQTQTITRPTPLPSLLTTTIPRRAYASNKKAKHGQKGHHHNNNSNDNTNETESKRARARAPIATTSLTPGSQQTLTNPAALEEFARADAKMASCVEWLRREVSQLEARASGRVTPQLLAPVRVSSAVSVSAGPSASATAHASSSEAKKSAGARLEELATVGVRDGTTLIVTVFDPQVSGLCCRCRRCVDAVSPPSSECHVVPRSHDSTSGRVH